MRGTRGLGIAALGLTLAACGGEVVTLGEAPRGSTPVTQGGLFGEPKLLTELVSDDDSDNPTLTGDLLEIYFTSGRDGGAGDVDVWTARRGSADVPFGEPEPVTVVNSDGFETSPAVSLDGLELFIGAERDGGLGEQDIWLSHRASRDDDWSELENVTELNSSAKDIPRPPAMQGRVMPLGSRRGDSDYYETFLAARPSGDEPFATPVELTELEVLGFNTIDGFLSEDGRTLYFNRSPGAGEDTGELYVSRRATATSAFGAAEPLVDLNTAADERDPWLSPDGRHLFFSSDRGGSLAIYEATAP